MAFVDETNEMAVQFKAPDFLFRLDLYKIRCGSSEPSASRSFSRRKIQCMARRDGLLIALPCPPRRRGAVTRRSPCLRVMAAPSPQDNSATMA
jgi:hypothetical protein